MTLFFGKLEDACGQIGCLSCADMHSMHFVAAELDSIAQEMATAVLYSVKTQLMHSAKASPLLFPPTLPLFFA